MDIEIVGKIVSYAHEVAPALAECINDVKSKYPGRDIRHIEHQVTATKVPSTGYSESELLVSVIIQL